MKKKGFFARLLDKLLGRSNKPSDADDNNKPKGGDRTPRPGTDGHGRRG